LVVTWLEIEHYIHRDLSKLVCVYLVISLSRFLCATNELLFYGPLSVCRPEIYAILMALWCRDFGQALRKAAHAALLLNS